MATINPAMAHNPADTERELLGKIILNMIVLAWWMTIAYSVTLVVYVQNKLKPFQGQTLKERRSR